MEKLKHWIHLSRQIYKHNWRYVWGTAAVCFFVYTVRPLISPVFIENLFDLLAKGQLKAFLGLGLWISLILLFIFLVSYLLIVYSDAWFIYLSNKGTVNSYRSLYAIPYYETEERYTKEEQNIRIANGCSGTMGAFAVTTQGLASLVCSGIILILLARIHYTFVIPAALLMICEWVRMLIESKYNRKYQTRMESQNGKLNGILLNTVLEAEQLMTAGDLFYMLDCFQISREEKWNIEKRKSILTVALEAFSDGVFAVSLSALYGFFTMPQIGASLSAGTVASTGTLFSSFRSNFSLMRTAVTAMPGCFVTIERLFDILAAEKQKVSAQGDSYLLKNVTLESKGRLLLENINLEIKPGEKIGIIGPNGSGKSTLLKTLLGEYIPSSGTIQLACPRESIRYCPSSSQLFSIPALENIKMGIAKEQEPVLCKGEEFMEKLPCALSEGEKKRVNLYRSLEARPALLIADEGDASLDQETADQFRKLLLEQSQTLLAVTHKYEWLNRFDRILVMENGTIKEIRCKGSSN